MFIEELQRAVTTAPRDDLPRLAEVLWKAHGAGVIGDEEAQELAEAIEARRRPPIAQKPASARRWGSRPRSNESLERRRRWVASGRLPPAIAAKFTMAEAATLAVIAMEVAKHGDCRLTVGHIAALAGICPRSVRNGVRAAEELGLITIKERRLTAFRNDTNVVTIVSTEWLGWLRLGGGGKSVPRSGTIFRKKRESAPLRGNLLSQKDRPFRPEEALRKGAGANVGA